MDTTNSVSLTVIIIRLAHLYWCLVSGLYRNDFECLGVYPFDGSTEPLYNEALRRLPPDEYDRFVFRMIRCAQCEITKSSVPPEELPTYEEVMQ